MFKSKGFTLLELMVSVSILMILLTIGIPSMVNFTVNMRVDREISTLHRMIAQTKNMAVNANTYIAICPLNNSNVCTTNWHSTITIFSDLNKNKKYEPSEGEAIIQVKDSINKNDKLQYGKNRTALIFGPTGHLAIWGGNATFKYCPKNHEDKNKGLIISRAGRAYKTTIYKDDGLHRNRSGKTVICK